MHVNTYRLNIQRKILPASPILLAGLLTTTPTGETYR